MQLYFVGYDIALAIVPIGGCYPLLSTRRNKW